jgi:hypothetical protein
MKTTGSDKKRSPQKDEKPLHLPGQSLDTDIKKLRADMTIYIVWIAFFLGSAFLEIWRWYWHIPPQPVVVLCIAAIAIPISLIKIRQIQNQIKNKQLGRQGEIEVGQLLEGLRKNGYVIFHDIVADDFNIDHVVIAPNGIFAVETKNWSKTSDYRMGFNGEQVLISGRQPNPEPIQQARANAKWLQDELRESTSKVFGVRPVVVFPKWWVTNTKENTDVWVLNPGQLEFKIAQEPRVLGQEDMHLIVYFLSRYIRNV